ncbi:MAG: hypothetical protein ACOCVG_00135 [Verrucomicrobiota bacterium]
MKNQRIAAFKDKPHALVVEFEDDPAAGVVVSREDRHIVFRLRDSKGRLVPGAFRPENFEEFRMQSTGGSNLTLQVSHSGGRVMDLGQFSAEIGNQAREWMLAARKVVLKDSDEAPELGGSLEPQIAPEDAIAQIRQPSEKMGFDYSVRSHPGKPRKIAHRIGIKQSTVPTKAAREAEMG